MDPRPTLRPRVLHRRLRLVWVALLLGATHATVTALAAESPVLTANSFQPNDRWTVVGDSITHSGTYHAWVHLFYLTRFPFRPLEVWNAGIAGDTAAGGLRRFDWDIRPLHGTVATVDFGMNDVMRGLYAPATPTSEQLAARTTAVATLLANERTLVTRLQHEGTRVILLTPSIFDDEADLPAAKLHGVNAALAECAQGIRQIAAETHSGLIDLHGPMLALNRRLQQTNPAFTLTGPDRIHPGLEGHFAMAVLFLQAQGVPADVARFALDATGPTITSATNSQATDLHRTADGLTFVWNEASLPFPLDPTWTHASEWLSFTRGFNQEILEVTGLPAPRYELRIDGLVIRPVTADELRTGLNLALETTTPQYRQALEVLDLVKKYSHQSAETLRNLALVEHQTTPPERLPATLETVRPFLEAKFATFKTAIPSANLLRIYNLYTPEKPREEESRKAIAALQALARQAAQPHPHRYELVALPSTSTTP